MEGNNLIGDFIGLITSPVTSFKKRAQEKNIKFEAIIAVAVAVVIALVTIINLYISAVKGVNAVYKSYKKYSEKYSYLDLTKEEYKEQKKEAKKQALELIDFKDVFFKTAVAILVVTAFVAGMLYVISRLVKSPKDYIELISFMNSAFLVYTAGAILSIILSLIYTPLGIIVTFATSIFAIFSLANSFKESLQLEDTNKLVICSTVVFTIVFAILVIIANKYIGNLLSFDSLL